MEIVENFNIIIFLAFQRRNDEANTGCFCRSSGGDGEEV